MSSYRKIRPVMFRNYRVLGILGRGLGGTVYLAQHDQELVALKRLDPHADDMVRNFFFNEQQLLRKAHHRHIVRYIDSGPNQKEPFLVMAFAEGTHLNQLIPTLPPPAAVVHMVSQVAHALHYLHTQHPDQPVIHCDIKPHNIVIDDEGNVVLLDLGSARTRYFAPAQNAVMLSPRYCGPEQFHYGHVPQSDQYALAVIAFELLTSKALFRNEQQRSKAEQQGKGRKDHAVVERMPAQFAQTAAVLDQALQREPSARYADVLAFAQAFAAAVEADLGQLEQGRAALIGHLRHLLQRQQRTGYRQVAAVLSLILLASAGLFLAQRLPFFTAPVNAVQAISLPTSVPSVTLAPSAPIPTTLAGLEPTSTLVPASIALAEDPTPTATFTPAIRENTARPSAPVVVQPRPTLVPRPNPTPRVVPPTPRPVRRPTNTSVPGVLIPALVGLGENQAKERLASLGISRDLIEVQYQSRSHLGGVFDQFQPYAVVSSLPAAGVFLPQGSKIILGIRAPGDDTIRPTDVPPPPPPPPTEEPKPTNPRATRTSPPPPPPLPTATDPPPPPPPTATCDARERC